MIKKTLSAVLIFFIISFLMLPSLNAETVINLEKNFIKISEEVGNAVVTISVIHVLKNQVTGSGQDPFLDEFLYHFFRGVPQKEFKQKGLGSGFIINKKGYILTNDHVVGDADEIEVTLPDGRHFPAKFIGSSPKNDIALIKIEGKNLPFLKLGNSDEVKPGQWSLALGNPFGNIVNNPMPTVTAGIISAIHRTINIREDDRIYGDLIQTDAAINQGNSGGPLVNLKGEVIGINTLIFSPSGGSVGIGFAIPINQGKVILDDLISGKEIKHAWLGIWLQDINRAIVHQFGLSEEKRGALVFKVEKESPAFKAGLKSGDIILKINQQTIQNSNDVSRTVGIKRPGDKIDCQVFRMGKEVKVSITLGEREEKIAKRKKMQQHQPEPSQIEWRGMTVDNITQEIAEKLKLSLKEGVVVVKVKFASQAHNARIQPGDIIYSIAQKPVTNINDFINIASEFKEGDVLIHTSRGYLVIFDEK